MSEIAMNSEYEELNNYCEELKELLRLALIYVPDNISEDNLHERIEKELR